MSASENITEPNPLLSDRLRTSRSYATPLREADPHSGTRDGDANEEGALQLPQLADPDEDSRARLRWLASFSGATTDAAVQALERGQPKRALELLEQGRSVFWNHRLQTHGPGDVTDEQLRDMAQRSASGGRADACAGHVAFAAELDRTGAGDKDVGGDNDACESFLRRQSFDELHGVAAHGAVTMLVAGQRSSYAIVVPSAEADPRVVPLPAVTAARLKELAGTFGDACKRGRPRKAAGAADSESGSVEECGCGCVADDAPATGLPRLSVNKGGRKCQALLASTSVLAELWKQVVRPVLRSLDLKVSATLPLRIRTRPLSTLQKSPLHERPRVWWCPAGPFVFLPIHAAGIYAADGATAEDAASDYVVSSYVPTLNALLRARCGFAPPPVADLRVLLLGQADAPGYTYLPGALAEVAALARAIPPAHLLSLGASSPAAVPHSNTGAGVTVRAVAAALPGASVLHFACHGVQARDDPLASGFPLQDGVLRIADLIRVPIPRALFAYLSACESAAQDAALPDEAVNLSAAMLFAGFRTVIGTLWWAMYLYNGCESGADWRFGREMEDADGPQVAAHVYEELLRGDEKGLLEPDVIPYALEAAVDRLRKKGLAPLRWATYVHMGL
jgi:hypothetical protein